MVEPMKPQKPVNTVNLGGVNFNSNDAKNYGLRVGKDFKLKYFIDLKNGGTVEYSKQPKDPLFRFYEEPKDPAIELDSYGRYKFHNLQDADIDFSGAKDGVEVRVFSSKNVKLTGSEHEDGIFVIKSEHCEVNSGDGIDFIFSISSNYVDINGGSGLDYVEIDESRNQSGKVHLDNDDILVIRNFEKETPVEIQGEGIHNLEETKFDEEQ